MCYVFKVHENSVWEKTALKCQPVMSHLILISTSYHFTVNQKRVLATFKANIGQDRCKLSG